MAITPKPFSQALKIVKRIFYPRPNILANVDINQHNDAVNDAYVNLSLEAGMLRKNWKVNIKLSKDTPISGGTVNQVQLEVNIQKTDETQPAALFYKGVRFDLPAGNEISYSGTYTTPVPNYPVGYLVLVASKHTITFSEDPTVAGISSDEEPNNLPSSDLVVYRNERLVLTDSPDTVTLAAEEENIGIIATIVVNDTSTMQIVPPPTANDITKIQYSKSFNRTVRYNAIDCADIASNYTMQVGDDLLAEINYSSQIGATQDLKNNKGIADIWASFKDYFNRKILYLKMVHKYFSFQINQINTDIDVIQDTLAKLGTGLGNVAAKTVVPIGGIIIYSGTFDQFDGEGKGKPKTDYENWHVCNGVGGTPDLRGRFVVGAIVGVPGGGDLAPEVRPGGPFGSFAPNYTMGATGGEPGHILTVNEMPEHDHLNTPNILINGDIEGGIQGSADWKIDNGTRTGKTGGGAMFNELPPYYAIAYLQRIA